MRDMSSSAASLRHSSLRYQEHFITLTFSSADCRDGCTRLQGRSTDPSVPRLQIVLQQSRVEFDCDKARNWAA
ncbi:hypothetical protein RRG08_045247 [Elysia crispata]|uniref:Uncharacterized protein n=1 Tax=Elysia crispata TaxID=231223 RepID=A0AAE1A2W8_9GAST|nr:hypothetical protein RRG08_045247 [Elysia crispata]